MVLRRFPTLDRGALGALENDLVDHLLTGRIDRRTFMRRASVLGLSLPLLAAFTGFERPASAQTRSGGTLRVAMETPSAAVNPVTTADLGGLTLLIQAGEFLCVTQPDLTLAPGLAERWTHNDDASVWTFTLRDGVRFHTGEAFSADDVVATVDRLADPAHASNALSAFKGILSKGGARKVDRLTVEFHLDGPHGSFPYVVSSDNYNCVMLPAAFAGDFETNWTGTGPFRLERYTPRVGASFVRNDAYWGPKALPDRVELKFYDTLPARVLALQGGEVDLIDQVPVAGGQAVLSDPRFIVIREPSTAHKQVHMRCDQGPFADKRVRRALALSIDRDKLVKGLLRGYGGLGNDSPFAPAFPSTDPSVPQRKQDLAEAKRLLAEAGVGNGFKTTLTTENYMEVPEFAVLMQNFARPLGIDITLKIEEQGAYYGKAKFGQSDWLDSPLGITDYGQRGVPDALLRAALASDGPWNAAHFKNPRYDAMVGTFLRAADIGAQRAAAGDIQRLLLDETPVIFAYYLDFLVVTRKGVSGVRPLANRLQLDQVSLAPVP